MKNNITYIRRGDYLYLNLKYTTGDRPIGIWGARRKDYLKEHRPGLYTELLLTGTLNDHLADINEQAEAMFERLTDGMAQREGVTEHLKQEDQLLWVAKMNMIQEWAREIVNHDLINA